MDRLFRPARHNVLGRIGAAKRPVLHPVDGHEPLVQPRRRARQFRRGARGRRRTGPNAGLRPPREILRTRDHLASLHRDDVVAGLAADAKNPLSDLLIRYGVAGLTAIADELHGSLEAPWPMRVAQPDSRTSCLMGLSAAKQPHQAGRRSSQQHSDEQDRPEWNRSGHLVLFDNGLRGAADARHGRGSARGRN